MIESDVILKPIVMFSFWLSIDSGTACSVAPTSVAPVLVAPGHRPITPEKLAARGAAGCGEDISGAAVYDP